jgi:4a-hydroxytetrahydrobiopterin dehydratase
MQHLDEEAIAVALQGLPDWSREGDALVRTITRRDWRHAIDLVVAVADEAEHRDHHPDVSVTGYRRVTFRLTTHSAGAISDRDVALARRIDELAAT